MLKETESLLDRFRSEFKGEIPQRIHSREGLDDGGVPQWHPEFARWLTAREIIDTPSPLISTPEHRLRTTRAMRKLRRLAVRQYEVVWRVCVQGEPLHQTTRWLNDRAHRNAIEYRYSDRDTLVMLHGGLDLMSWYY